MSSRKKNESPVVSRASAKKTPVAPVGKVYTDESIALTLAEGYTNIPQYLWDHLPTGSHVRYFKKDDGSGKPKAERFKPGGFVKALYVAGDKSAHSGKKMLWLENKPGGKEGQSGYISFSIVLDDTEEIWKKLPRDSFIEICMINLSLREKNKRIEDLESQIKDSVAKYSEISTKYDALVGMLRQMVGR